MSSITNDGANQPGAVPPTTDLRHMASQPTLLPPSPSRPTQPLNSLSPNRPGSRSPTSIPSSPTSIRSSSSAIFERDIETPPNALPLPHHAPHYPANPHRTPRSKATEQIEQSVPSVLAEAASALAASNDSSDISIIAPAPASLSFSQAGSVGSRSPPMQSRSPSPSPSSRKLTLPSPSTSPSANGSPLSAPTHVHWPLTPGAFFSVTPTTAHSPSPIPSPTTATSPLPPPLPPSVPDPTSSLHATTSPAHSKRLSFISYSDLLSCTPITSLPLSSLTSPHSTMPPPHLPIVSAAATISASPSATHSQGAPSRPLSTYSIGTSGGFSLSGGGCRVGGSGEEQQGVGKRLKDDIGGEWEREGFGKGLEERLEELMVGKA
ncbi:hypothetical protein JB92DRAFT_3035691 [Gautieria morchelliformis]|nr:hypothetical protein JB92DRAFT_3035691 [Gautieria morchelliformis]